MEESQKNEVRFTIIKKKTIYFYRALVRRGNLLSNLNLRLKYDLEPLVNGSFKHAARTHVQNQSVAVQEGGNIIP